LTLRFKAVNLIDFDGYRPNVGIVICNQHGQVLWAKRLGQNSWQFPQGGINEGENIEQAMYRELYEEVGLTKKDVRLIWASKYWLKYRLPKRLIRHDSGSNPVCIGQKQRWFLLQLLSPESAINLRTNNLPEFDGWRWVSFWYPVRQVVSFKRDVYRKVMKEFAQVLLNEDLTQLNRAQTHKPLYKNSDKYKSERNGKRELRKPFRPWNSRRKTHQC
jgi:putative (di)nucleoside polyphosphate hydrolase